MRDQAVKHASDTLVRHWNEGTRLDALPGDLRPATREEGYAIQATLMAHTRQPLYGWKIAATSEAGQRHINVSGPMAGRLLAERVIADGATVPLAGTVMRVAEVEFGFRFGQDLPPRAEPYSVDEVLAAVESLHPVIEVPDTRYTDVTAVGAPQIIADNACAHVVLPGPAVTADWRGTDLAAHEVMAVKNGSEEHRGVGANVLGDPRVALAWLVNELSGLGITVEAGQLAITGTCVVPVAVAPGDEVRADLGDFGTLMVRFA